MLLDRHLPRHSSNKLDIFVNSIVVGKYPDTELGNKFAVKLQTPLAIIMSNIIQVGSQLNENIQKWAIGEYPTGLKVIFPKMHMKSSDLVPIAKKLEFSKCKEFSMLGAKTMLGMFRTDYHCLKINFERQYDQVINTHIFQFLTTLEPKLYDNFYPPCILNLDRKSVV